MHSNLPQSSRCFSPVLSSLQHQWLTDPEDTYAAIRPTATICSLHSLVAAADYFHFISHLRIHNAHLMGFGSSPLRFGVEHCPSIHLVACFGGSRRVRMPQGEVACSSGGALLLPPGARVVDGGSNNAIFTLKPQAIAQAALAMAGRQENGGRSATPWDAFQPLAWAPGPQARQIHALVRHIDACAAVDPQLPAKLALDDLLHRQVAALLNPSLLQEVPADSDRHRSREGKSSFDDLIDYIRANLDQPLRLSDLERRSHYSRRSLQYAFRNKLGSTPKQWIRQQRLQAAIEQLRNGDRSWSVQAVALRCGYRSLSLFSADFKRQFGLSPSQARRRPLLQSSPSPPMGSARPTTAGKVGKTV